MGSESNPQKAGTTWPEYVKGMLGLNPGATSTQPAGGQTFASSAGVSTDKPMPHGPPPPTLPTPIKTRSPVGGRDSLPEIVTTPSDIGIWEVSHELRGSDGKFTWKKLFQPGTSFKANSGNNAPSPSKK